MKLSKELKIGLAGLCALALLYCGINFLRGINLFSSYSRYYVQFEDASKLTKSSPVYANGFSIGLVSNIEYDFEHTGHVIVAIDVDPRLQIPEGSEASLETEMLGTVRMNLQLNASNPKMLAPGGSLKGQVNSGLMSAAADMMPAVQQMLPKLDSILTAVNALVNDPAVANALHHTEEMTGNLSRTTAKLDKVMNTLPELTNTLNQVCLNAQSLTAHMDEKIQQLDVEGTMQKVNQTLANVEQLSAKLNSQEGTLGLLMNDPSLYQNLNLTMNNAALLLDDLRQHPKRYVHFSIFGKKDKPVTAETK